MGNGERFVSIWEFRELLERGGPQYVRPDVGLAGGPTHCQTIAAIAESHHCAVVTAASLHKYTLGDEGNENAVFKRSYRCDGGYLELPQAPGPGVELDDTLLASTPFPPLFCATSALRDDGSVAYAV